MEVEEYSTLQQALEDILPGILMPDTPMKGGEIIDRVMEVVGSKWEPVTIRYHLTILSCNPNSVVAKYYDADGRRRQGFVLRPFSERAWDLQKQGFAIAAVEAAACLADALNHAGDTHPVFWSRVAAAQRDLEEALVTFNTHK